MKEEAAMSDRRRSTLVREIVVPVVVSVLVGIGSSFMATRVAIAVLDEKVKGIQQDVVNLSALVQAVNDMRVETAIDHERINNMEENLRQIKQRLE